MREREPRHTVALRARMHTLKGWSDVAIRDVSRHGMMLQAMRPPRPGSYLELRRNRLVVVARAIWRDGDRFGVRSQDPIDFGALHDGGAILPRPTPGVEVERRSRPRPVVDQVERARIVARLGQFGAIVLVLAVAAMLAAEGVDRLFGAPLRAVERALDGSAR